VRALLGCSLLLASCGSAGAGNDGEPEEQRAEQAPPPAGPLSPVPATTTSGSPGRTVECASGEAEVFSCKVAGGNCGTGTGTGRGEAEYRFGDGEPELVLSGGRWASVPYSGGGEAQVAFASGDTRYVVFSRIVRTNFAAGEPNDPAISDGVIVLEGEEVIGIQLCDDPDVAAIDYDLAEAHFARADDLFSWETDLAERRTR
jgi:hypothetical protein